MNSRWRQQHQQALLESLRSGIQKRKKEEEEREEEGGFLKKGVLLLLECLRQTTGHSLICCELQARFTTFFRFVLVNFVMCFQTCCKVSWGAEQLLAS